MNALLNHHHNDSKKLTGGIKVMQKINKSLLFTELTDEASATISGGVNNNIIELLQILLPLVSSATTNNSPPTPYSPFVSPQFTGGLSNAFTPVSGVIFSIF
jgi:hypothetical protein